MNRSTLSEDVRTTVREFYKQVAETDGAAGCAPGCASNIASDQARKLGYSEDEVAAVPVGANLGLGCGNPQTIAGLRPGEVVVDLGSGAGFDCFLAARQVGSAGRVIGVDMTPEMIAKARAHALKTETDNVEFRLGEFEHLPVDEASVDVVISNCVVNLAPDKAAVYRDVFRVLVPGGRLAISDVLATQPVPDALMADLRALAGCVAGAVGVLELSQILEEAGFESVQVEVNEESRALVNEWMPGTSAGDYVASATILARKPWVNAR